LILRYTITNPHCHSTIVGTCNLQHLSENVAAVAKGPLSPDLCNDLRQRVSATLANE
jgi:aryl-alcohol dehydrogenase-like predicted oxidoreductase